MKLGPLVDLLFLALAAATLVGWGYFWFLCVTNAGRILKPLFGEAALAVACIGFPFVFFGLLYLLTVSFGKDVGSWVFVVLGATLPILGIWSVKAGKWM